MILSVREPVTINKEMKFCDMTLTEQMKMEMGKEDKQKSKKFKVIGEKYMQKKLEEKETT